jgi:hypothetical protein
LKQIAANKPSAPIGTQRANPGVGPPLRNTANIPTMGAARGKAGGTPFQQGMTRTALFNAHGQAGGKQGMGAPIAKQALAQMNAKAAAQNKLGGAMMGQKGKTGQQIKAMGNQQPGPRYKGLGG